MEFQELADLICREVKAKIESHQGLALFARHRAKFEGWLKVELCDSLAKHFRDVVPERDRVDVSFDNWRIELKTVNTNLRVPGVEAKTRPITKNIASVLEDIEKLRSLRSDRKAVCFVVFPVPPGNEHWEKQLAKVRDRLAEVRSCPFLFRGGVPGAIYLGLVK